MSVNIICITNREQVSVYKNTIQKFHGGFLDQVRALISSESVGDSLIGLGGTSRASDDFFFLTILARQHRQRNTKETIIPDTMSIKINTPPIIHLILDLPELHDRLYGSLQ
jgi:hypothetical protein